MKQQTGKKLLTGIVQGAAVTLYLPSPRGEGMGWLIIFHFF